MKVTGKNRGFEILGLSALWLVVFAPLAGAQEGHSWEAFFGCWMPAQQGRQEARQGAEEIVLCFREAGDDVQLSTIVDGEVTALELLVADGRERPAEADGCRGYKGVEFSSDGRRAFTRSELTCEGETRSNAGVLAFVSTNRLIHVREVGLEGEPVSWIEEYHPVSRQWYLDNQVGDPSAPDREIVLARRARASQPITTSDVEEAASRLGPGAVQLWVAVQPSDFDLDGDEILHLADSGVPESVIDVMVAAAFPDRFTLSMDGTASVAEAPREPPRPGYSVPYGVGYRSYVFDPFYIPGYYFYSAYGYPYYSRYAPGFYLPRGGGGGGVVVEPQPSSQGRMVNGRGYRRNSSSPRSAQPRVSASRRPASVSVPEPPPPSSAPAVTSSSSESSSSGSAPASPSRTPTGRTARPR